jgi:hypothetical protein
VSWHKFRVFLFLGIPLPLYLFLSATLFNITPTHKITGAKIDEINLIVQEDEGFIYTDNQEAIMSGNVAYNEVLAKYGFYIDETSIIQVGFKYYGMVLEENQYVLTDIKTMEIQRQQQYKLPLSFFISIASILIVILVVQGKMQWHKTYPRLATFIALLTGTVILTIIKSIVGDIQYVFLIATTSWGMYCLEYLYYTNKITSKQLAKTQSTLVSELENRLK